ncbi:MAG TPA: bifunctional ornithine acetyltransferase/N-acetylglutamate synthase [Euryarchaeota archaeon]|nr:bifunctional ornithine acetyltransferase/N-acetylglutamate synthase [Euryarchaeota archaeon]
MSNVSLIDGGVTAPNGFSSSGIHCGVKHRRKDLALLFSSSECSAAALYTTNRAKAAPLMVTQSHLTDGRANGAVISSGYANALTGERGLRDAEEMARVAGKVLGCDPRSIVVATTGVIGEYLPMDKIVGGIEKAGGALGTTKKHARDSALAIMTTDTVPKMAAASVALADGTKVTLGGMAKGSGMISPELKKSHATMLCFITTDAAASPKALELMLASAADETLNMLNVDGDRSTNDMCVIFANGAANNSKIADCDPIFLEALKTLLQSLTKQLARDGEGAKKMIEAKIIGAGNLKEARVAARAVVMSNLVKAAVFGEDPNFGRIISAIGASGAELNLAKIELRLVSEYGIAELMSKGELVALVGNRTYARARQLLKSNQITIEVDLGTGGNAEATAWGCDLTYDYVKINAEYTT